MQVQLLLTLLRQKMISFDTETHLIKQGNNCPKIVCCSWAKDDQTGIILGQEETTEFYRDILYTKEEIAGANIAYDNAVVCNADTSLLKPIFQHYLDNGFYDCLIGCALDAIANGHLLLDPKTGKPIKGYSLENVVRLWLHREDAKKNDSWRLRYSELDGIPLEQWPQEAREYPLDDAKNTLEASLVIKAKGRNQHNVYSQSRAGFALHLASVWGMRTNEKTITELENQIVEKLNLATKRFSQANFIKEDGRQNNKVVKTAIARAYGAEGTCSHCFGSGKADSPKNRNLINCKKCSSTGLDLSKAGIPKTLKEGLCTDRDTLEESGDDLLVEYAGVSKLHKIQDTYLPFLKTGISYPITSRPNVLLATGRTSDGVKQTLPRDFGVRNCFIPREGYYFCSVDYSAIELVTLAQCLLWITGSSSLGDAINSDLDPHTFFASQMYGIDYYDLLHQIKTGDKAAKGKRQAAKAANFGFPGGMSPVTLVLAQRKIGLHFCRVLEGNKTCGERVANWGKRCITPTCKRCIELAEELSMKWFRQWPEMKRYHQWVKVQIESTGELMQFVSKRVRGALDFCNGANTLFQGLAADGAKHALFEISRECYSDTSSPLFGSRVVGFFHDEIFCEVRIENAHKAAYRISELMVSSMKIYTPDIKVKAEPCLMLEWDKNAETMHNEKGELIPWEKN